MNRDLLHDLYLKQIQALYEAVERIPDAEQPPSQAEAQPRATRRSPKMRSTKRSVPRQREEAPARRTANGRNRRAG
jgi:hypothetical protein